MLNVYFEDFNHFNIECLYLIQFDFYIEFLFKLFGIIFFLQKKKTKKWVSSHNLPTRGGPGRVDILLTHTKVDRAGLAHFQFNPLRVSPRGPNWPVLTALTLQLRKSIEHVPNILDQQRRKRKICPTFDILLEQICLQSQSHLIEQSMQLNWLN